MARIDEKDLFQYHKLDNQFRDHYLINAFNETIDLIEGKKEHKGIVLSQLMTCVDSTVKSVEDLKRDVKNKDNYIKYLQNQIFELINKIQKDEKSH